MPSLKYSKPVPSPAVLLAIPLPPVVVPVLLLPLLLGTQREALGAEGREHGQPELGEEEGEGGVGRTLAGSLPRSSAPYLSSIVSVFG